MVIAALRGVRGFKVSYEDPGVGRAQIPTPLTRRILRSLRNGTLGVGMDYDNTMVTTIEEKRVFTRLDQDTARVIDPMIGLLTLGLPLGIFTGNTQSYINDYAVGPFHERLAQHDLLHAMELFDVYAQNATLRNTYDRLGELGHEASKEYRARFLFPEKDMEEIKVTYQQAVAELVTPFPDSPIVTRRSGMREEVTFPVFQDRSGVMAAWIGVPKDLREKIIQLAVSKLAARFARQYRHELGGDYSIDINKIDAAKHNGTNDFRARRGLDVLMYFGDSVSIKAFDEEGRPTEFGNDYPAVWDKGAIVFAVNPDQSTVPQHERIIAAGPNPPSTAAWLKWLLIEKANHIITSPEYNSRQTALAIRALSIGGVI